MTEININQDDSSIPTNIRNNYSIKTEKINDEKNYKSIQDLTNTMIVKNKVENYSLDDLGKIENAKKHRSANRPLHKIKEFTNYVNFCRCCNLPCEKEGIIEPFKCCEDIDQFSECGLGITLFFYFFQFMTLIVFIGIIIISISMIIFNHIFTGEIDTICKNFTKEKNSIEDCNKYFTLEKYNYNYESSENGKNYYDEFNVWILRLSSDNIKIYRDLSRNLEGRNVIGDQIDNIVVNYSILIFCYLITCFIINIYFIIFVKAQTQKARILSFSIRDYTVLISDAKQILYDYVKQKNNNSDSINKSQIMIENGEDFKKYVNEYIKGRKYLGDLEINNINMCYDLGKYIGYRDEYENCKRKIFQIEHNPYNIKLNNQYNLKNENRLYYKFHLLDLGLYFCYCCIYDYDLPLKILQNQKLSYEAALEKEQQDVLKYITRKNFTGYMFISFNKIKDKEKFLAEYPHNFFDMVLYFLKNIKYYICCCCINKEEYKRFRKVKGIDAHDPPEPEDIIWENFNYSARQRGIRTILVFLISILLIILSLGIIFGLTFIQDYLNADDRQAKHKNIFFKYLISLIITGVISIINAIFQLILERLTYLEKQISKSNYTLSLSIKITIFTFLNSAIVPLISKYLVLFHNKSKDIIRERNNLLIDDMLVYFIINAIITPLLWIVDIPYLFRRMHQCYIEKGKNPDNNHYMTQRDLNKLYEYPDMNLAYKYSYIAKTTAMCFFYMPIFPLCFIFSFIGFIFGYFLEKFNFTHLYKRPEMLDEIITKVYTNYFIIILFIGGIGNYVFLHNVYNNNTWPLINIILFGILIIIPYTKFINCNFVGIDKSEYLNYPLSNVYFTFYNDYQRQNPLTKKMGILNYLSELKKRGYLSDYAYEIAQENIEQLNLMEIYYGISRGIIPIAHQSLIANSNNSSILSKNNLGRRFLRSAIIKPEIEDNTIVRKRKKQFFDSQILNMFGKGNINESINLHQDTIESKNEINEVNENEKKDQLIDAYNNPLGINMGLGPLPLTINIYKNKGKNQDSDSEKKLNDDVLVK